MYGRRVFFERAKAMIEEKAAGYYILSSINVENLKFINSAYGLDSGDAVLRHIADCTVRCMAAIGGIAGRINGDAFAALFRHPMPIQSFLQSFILTLRLLPVLMKKSGSG